MTTWERLRQEYGLTEDGQKLADALYRERREHTVYPRGEDVFRAFDLTPFEDVRIIVLGQDPYHGVVPCNMGCRPRASCTAMTTPQAHGLAFSVPRGVPIPPSLRNIFKEAADGAPECDACEGDGRYVMGDTLERCIQCHGTGRAWRWTPPTHGDLTAWAKQGVLLLNTALTVRAGKPKSHVEMWRGFTTAVLHHLMGDWTRPTVWLLWGKDATRAWASAAEYSGLPVIGQEWRSGAHLMMYTSHPSPLSARKGFIGCGHFRRANEWLEARGEKPIDWRVP